MALPEALLLFAQTPVPQASSLKANAGMARPLTRFLRAALTETQELLASKKQTEV